MPTVKNNARGGQAKGGDEEKGAYANWKSPMGVNKNAKDAGPENDNNKLRMGKGFPNPMGFTGIGKD